MKTPEIPENEASRINALCSLNILDTPQEERFDRITRVAQKYFNVSIALVSLVDTNRQWFKSRQGLDAAETPRDISFCGHAILSRDIFYIPNALEDERFADNPLVTGPPNLRFYAGAPLGSAEGERVGTLCIIDDKPRSLTGEDMSVLRDLADAVEAELDKSNVLKDRDALSWSEERHLALFNTVVDGIVVIDASGIIQSANPSAVSIFGYSEQELAGKKINTLMPEPYASEHDGYLDHYFKTGEKKIIGSGREVVGLRRNGSTFPMDLSVGEMEVAGQKMFTGVIRDVSERKQSESVLRQYQAIIQSSDDAIISKDMNGMITSWNTGAEIMFGYSPEEVIGHPMLMLFPEDRQKEEQLILEKLSRGENINHFETMRKRKDGSLIDISVTISPIQNEEGVIVGASKIAKDITERKQIEQLKNEFVSTVSHELRTPLTSIRGALGLLKGKFASELPEKAANMLDMADRNCERLTLLINDILDLEKIESGNLDFEFGKIDLVRLAKRALEDNKGYALKNKVNLGIELHLESAIVRGDESRLLQVFANLISNAIKFSPPCETVTISVLHGRQGIRVEVRDHGTGIPEEFRERIFQRFAQADSSDTREKGGTGLGLSISKAIVDRHLGIIDFEPAPGEGTIFYFEIPEWEEVLLSTNHSTGVPRILICEDNLDVARILSEMLETEGVQCDIVTTGNAALEQLSSYKYELLLLDLSLPDTDGLSLLSLLRANPKTADLPVIVVSGRAKEGQVEFKGDALAVVDWLQKPVDKTRLEKALQEALQKNNRPRILHVEDDPDIVQITSSLLEDMANVTTIESVKGARKLLSVNSYDMVILDLELADGSGIELIGDLKDVCPVVIFSAHEPSKEVTQMVEAALTKSTATNEKLMKTIQNVLQGNVA